MGAVSELYAMRRSFSADRTVKHQSRSGDDKDGAALVLDFVAHVQSAEANIVEAEERAERQESKRQFVRLLRLYFKTILSEQERQFLAECLRSGETPYKVGRALGLDYRTVIESIQCKYEADADKLAALMRVCGYSVCKLVFMPKLLAYYNKMKVGRVWRSDHKEEVNAVKRANYSRNAERVRSRAIENSRRYYKANRAKVMAYKAKYYHTPQRQDYIKRYRTANKEKMRAYQKAYREAKKRERAENIECLAQ